MRDLTPLLTSKFTWYLDAGVGERGWPGSAQFTFTSRLAHSLLPVFCSFNYSIKPLKRNKLEWTLITGQRITEMFYPLSGSRKQEAATASIETSILVVLFYLSLPLSHSDLYCETHRSMWLSIAQEQLTNLHETSTTPLTPPLLPDAMFIWSCLLPH